MQVAKWGNSLAVRIPAKVARELGLSEGDEIELRAAERDVLTIDRDRRRDEIIEEIRKLARPLPADYKFDRDEANAR
ncbi:MAG: AbrB family transcriptional regulator [Sphingomonas bacterium]|uniref:AbrB/MazE/SpoVT family DNA-binding domain-containing protein n=1 Tax=Sphingomonas bacterium TaxID=1895847 RepID=UPI002627BF70|nr:AbrB/MazE/SpoVT family DNA-binding domain-containing protein [Sphingomonas bacterium]MDB5696805.1 AbrB family transcriptional regulator [Sphingomonas bacterium]